MLEHRRGANPHGELATDRAAAILPRVGAPSKTRPLTVEVGGFGVGMRLVERYTPDQIETAMQSIGLADHVPYLLTRLSTTQAHVTLAGNAPNPDHAYPDMPGAIMRLYDALGSWQAVADELGLSKAYWWRVAHNRLAPSAEAVGRLEAHVTGEMPGTSTSAESIAYEQEG